MLPDPRVWREWCDLAREDLEAARMAAASGRLLRTAAYHAQQAAEKALKGVLIRGGEPLPRIHDLEDLLRRAEQQDPELAGLREDCRTLTGYYFAMRYPPVASMPTPSQVAGALVAAQRIVNQACGPETSPSTQDSC